MSERALRFWIGLFVLTSLALLGVLVVWFTGVPGFLTPYNRYTIVFTDAPGVTPGTPVRRSGVRIGEVQKVELDDETGKVRVGILIETKYTLRKNEQPTLTHGLLTGDTSIDLVPRPRNGEPPDRTPIPPGSELVGVRLPDARGLMTQAADVVPVTQETLIEMRRTAQRFDKVGAQIEEAMPEFRKSNSELRELIKVTRDTVPELRRTNDEIQVAARNWGRLGERLDVLLQGNQDKLIKALDNFNEAIIRIAKTFDDDNLRNLAATLKNVRAASDQLEGLTKNTDELLKESRVTVKKVGDSVTQADSVLANLQKATKPLADRSENIAKNLEESMNLLSKTLLDARELMRVLSRNEGTLQKLINDPALYNNLNDVTLMATKILPRVDRALRDLEIFADKIARHPELLGLSGAVKPSSGLKDPPTYPRISPK